MVREVGIDGSFLGHEHTVRHCRSGEVWYPALLDRTAVGADRKELYGRAHAEAEVLLAAHEPRADDAARAELESYVQNLP